MSHLGNKEILGRLSKEWITQDADIFSLQYGNFLHLEHRIQRSTEMQIGSFLGFLSFHFNDDIPVSSNIIPCLRQNVEIPILFMMTFNS